MCIRDRAKSLALALKAKSLALASKAKSLALEAKSLALALRVVALTPSLLMTDEQLIKLVIHIYFYACVYIHRAPKIRRSLPDNSFYRNIL